jgi:hypothetical protein
VIGAIVAAGIGEFQELADADPNAWKREVVVELLAEEKLKTQGVDLDSANDEQWDEAMQAAETEVAGLSQEQLDARLSELEPEFGAEEDAEQIGEGGEVAAQPAAAADADRAQPFEANLEDDEAAADFEEEGGGFGALVGSMFQPMDGLWILLAFFTAYKVGSGQMTD